jgi:fucose permease
LAVAIAGLYALNSDKTLPLFLFAIGLFAGVQVCGASTLVSTLWQEKPRQTMLIAQDAMFNGGGIIFTALTTWFLTSGFHWASTYAVVGVLALAISTIAARTELKHASVSEETPTPQTQWAPGILLVGISLLLFMTAKISIFIWAPQYIVERFDADIAASGGLLTNIFIGAFCGSLAGTWLVSRIQIDYFLMIMLTIGATGLWMLVSVEDLQMALITAYIVGASVGATFNGYTAFGLSFVAKPTHKHVAYILVAGGIGSGAAPWFSSAAVERLGSVSAALVIFLGIQVTVLVSVLLLSLYKHLHQREDQLNSVTRS